MKMGRIGALLLAATSIGWATEPTPTPSALSSDSEQAAYSNYSGAELVRLLKDKASRIRAFYELDRRNTPSQHTEFEQFAEWHGSPEIVVCPQPEAQPPIYLVLYKFLPSDSSTRLGQYKIEKADELFPNTTPFRLRNSPEAPAIDAFDSKGRRLNPFGGRNVLEGALADINGDGLIERVEGISYSIDGIESVDVLEVSAIKPNAQPMFAVLLNWGADEWDFRLSAHATEGVADIEIGPRTPDSLNPKAVFKWDKEQHAYTGPASGAHFRVLDSAHTKSQLEHFKAEHLAFPKDPEAFVPREEHSLKSRAPAPPSNPYCKTSLAALSDPELLHYMGRGKASYDFEAENKIRNRLPAGFWALEPKAAALALIDCNRANAHRNAFLVALDDRDQPTPPAVCSLAFSDSSSRCYNAVDAHYFLRVDPENSYLAYAREWSGGAVFYNLVHDQPAFDLRLCPLPYIEAKKIADVIWWLDHVRSMRRRTSHSFGSSFSTADGHGRLTLRSHNGLPLLKRHGTLWAAQLSERWSGEFDQESCLNFASYLISDVLPQHLGRSWAQWEPSYCQDILARKESAPRYAEQELTHIKNTSERFLSLFTRAQDQISFALVSVAAEAAGALPMPDAMPQLRAVANALPPPASPMRSYEEVSAETAKVAEEGLKSPQARKQLEQKSDALSAEIDAILADASPDSTGHLRRTTDLTLRQIATAQDPARLLAWATSTAEGSQWALQRLATLDRTAYATALEWWIARSDGKWARQLFEELNTVAPERASKIARDLPPDKAGALTLSAFALLSALDTVPDEPTRLAAIIRVLHDPNSGWQERSRAIELLVPPEKPMRYPAQQVDEALLKLLAPDQADDTINFTLSAACRALARRGKVEHFDRIVETLSTIKDAGVYSRILGALTQLAQVDPARFNPQLLAIIKPNLAQTNIQMAELLWCIWSADLREVKPELERLATASPDDYEDPKACSYGGSVTPVDGRFHLARKIVSIWNEDDDTARARLLAGLALGECNSFISEPVPERLRRLQIELGSTGAKLTTAQRDQIAALLHSFDHRPADSMSPPETGSEIAALVRTALGKQNSVTDRTAPIRK